MEDVRAPGTKMRTLLMGNGDLAAWIAEYLELRGELIGIVQHPADRRYNEFKTHRPMETWGEGVEANFPPSFFRDVECVLSVNFGYILNREWLGLASWLPLNLHTGYLPWNRGTGTSIWPLVDGSPAGVTLHVMTEKVDQGPIVVRRRVQVCDGEMVETLRMRLVHAGYMMFTDVWPRVRRMGRFELVGVGTGEDEGGVRGSWHSSKDVADWLDGRWVG